MRDTLKHLAFPVLAVIVVSLVCTTELRSQAITMSDIDGNVYPVVAIGDQWWMAANLKVTKYANGEEIPYLKASSGWASDMAGAYCYYADNPNNAESYGNLYNWYVTTDQRGVCPSGWHVPSDEEWIIMERSLGMSAEAALGMTAWRGTDEGDQLKSESFGGNNSSGFNATGTGYRDPDGIYKAMGTDNDYWTSTPYQNKGRTEGVLHGLHFTKRSVVRNFHVPGYGFCIRCVKNEPVGAVDKK